MVIGAGQGQLRKLGCFQMLGKILAEGAVFQIRGEGSLAVCEMKNAQSVTAEEGASCARLIRDTLHGKVITHNSDYAALLFDLRKAPPAFGPKTRRELAAVFERAGELGFKVGVLTSTSATQRLQFYNLCREFAPNVTHVGAEVDKVNQFCDGARNTSTS